jgi:Secretion system C-terminal sorting domain
MKAIYFILLIFNFLVFQSGFSQISNLGTNTLTSGGATTNQAAAPIIDPLPLPPNVITFDYDVAGNQWKRRFIYVASGVYRQTNQPVATQPKREELLESDISSEILYYPNPVVSELFLKWTNSEANAVQQIELYNMNGQLMRRFENLKNEENTVVNFESYPSGYYILNLTYSTGEVKNLRIIKE